MSILIPGMEMPTACIYCPFMVSLDGDDCILQSNEANASFMTWEQMKAGCPLIELPPHVGIMDYDSLNPDSEWSYNEDGYTAYSMNAIRAACIPADPEKEDT